METASAITAVKKILRIYNASTDINPSPTRIKVISVASTTLIEFANKALSIMK